MKVGVIGYGKMGQLVESLVLAQGDTPIVFNRDDPLTTLPDIFIDFSTASSVLSRLKEAIALHRPIVIGTTGWDEQLPKAHALIEKSKIAALYAPNFSIGVFRFTRLLDEACRLLHEYDKVGIDTHHREKRDAPSGTACQLMKDFEIPFASVRLGSAAARLEVHFDGPDDTITLTHQAKSRVGFARGALEVADWLITQTGWKTLNDYLHSTHHAISR